WGWGGGQELWRVARRGPPRAGVLAFSARPGAGRALPSARWHRRRAPGAGLVLCAPLSCRRGRAAGRPAARAPVVRLPARWPAARAPVVRPPAAPPSAAPAPARPAPAAPRAARASAGPPPPPPPPAALPAA